MKSLFLCIIFLLISVSAMAAEREKTSVIKGVLESEKLTKVALYVMLKHRCNRYLGDQKNHRKNCKEGTKQFLEAIDIQPITVKGEDGSTKSNNIAFAKELVSLINDPKTYLYLDGLMQDLGNMLIFNRFNLWESSLKLMQSPEKAMKMIAILFQDITPIRTHFQYLAQIKPTNAMAYNANMTTLNELLTVFSHELFKSMVLNSTIVTAPSNIEFYPSYILDRGFGLTFYHYYVPAYATQKMLAKKVATAQAAFIPFAFNYIYEIFHTKNTILYSLFEPKTLENEGTQADIHVALLGGLFVTEKFSSEDPLDELRSEIGPSPREYLKAVAKYTLEN